MQVLCILFQAAFLVILGRIILEWIPVDYDHPVGRIRGGLRSITEPVLAPVRALIPPVRLGNVGLDLSALIVLVIISLLTARIC